MERNFKDEYTKNKYIITTLNFDPSLKKRLFEFFDTLKTQEYDTLDIHEKLKQAKVRSVLDTAYDAIMAVHVLEELYAMVIFGAIPPFMGYMDIFDSLDKNLPGRDDLMRSIISDTEEELENQPDTFSEAIIGFAEARLKELLAGKLKH